MFLNDFMDFNFCLGFNSNFEWCHLKFADLRSPYLEVAGIEQLSENEKVELRKGMCGNCKQPKIIISRKEKKGPPVDVNG